jgi:hypothetical protein
MNDRGTIMHLRLTASALASALGLTGCLVSGPYSRDQHRTVDTIRQEHRWAGDQIGKPLSAEELGRVRAGDQRSMARAQRRLARLLDGLDRVLWIREATPRAVWASIDDKPDLDELAFRFARAAQLRREALAEADEVAEALATSAAPSGLRWADLRRALDELAVAERSETKIQSDLSDLAAKEPALRPELSRFPPLAPPQPRPFVAAAGAYLRSHPEQRGELDRLPRELSADVEHIRRALAEEPPPPAQPPIAARPPVGEPPPVAPPPPDAVKPIPPVPSDDERAAVRNRAADAQRELDNEAKNEPPMPGAPEAPPPPAAPKGPGGLLQLQGDAQKMLTQRGLPRAMGQRPDGTFALRYEEPRPCSAGSCQTLVDYLFGPTGNLLREEVVGPSDKPAAPINKPDDNPGDPDD